MGMWILEDKSMEHVPGTNNEKHHRQMNNNYQGLQDTSMISRDLKLQLQTLLD